MFKHSYTLLMIISYPLHTQSMDINPSNTINPSVIITDALLESGLTQDQANTINTIAHEYYQNELDKLQANIQEDLDIIKAATSLTGFLEVLNKVIKIANAERAHIITGTLKDAARINMLHKLLMGANPGKFDADSLYTDAKTESVGFTLNNLVLIKTFEFIAKTKVGDWFSENLYLSNMPESSAWITKNLFVGLVTHLVWSGQKALWKFYQSKQ